jgi:hypothetical protein
MKNSMQCPKCASRRLWIVQQFGAKDPGEPPGRCFPLRVAGRKTVPTRTATTWRDDGSTYYDAGFVDAYICAACGYTELWSHGLEDLVHNPVAGVHLVDASARVPPMR